MIGLNMKGPFRLSAVIGARMCDQDWADGETGSIINVSSNASQRPNMSAAVYGAAKLSLNYFTELFAEVRACERASGSASGGRSLPSMIGSGLRSRS